MSKVHHQEFDITSIDLVQLLEQQTSLNNADHQALRKDQSEAIP